jgi:hypothetical protein
VQGACQLSGNAILLAASPPEILMNFSLLATSEEIFPTSGRCSP